MLAQQHLDRERLKLINSGDLYKDQLIIMLQHIPMFKDFDDSEIHLLASYLNAYEASQGTVLLSEGKLTGHLCFLIEGRLEVFKDIGQGQKKKLAEIRSGKSIGEMSVIDNLPNSATVIVSVPSILVLISRADLQNISQQQPKLGVKLLWHIANLLSQRLRHTSGRLIDRL